MSAHNDIVTLQRRIDHLTRAAARIRAQLEDVHASAWERPNTSQEKVRETKTDYVPAVGDLAPPARHLWKRTERELEIAESLLIGLERSVTGFFMVSAAVEPTRGSLISGKDHDQLLANQRRRRADGQYTPTPLVDQPRNHVGRRQ